jgi:hypothetical protein
VLLDPGEHMVSAQRGEERIERTVKLEEGLETRVELPFKPKPVQPQPPGPDTGPPDLGLGEPAAAEEGPWRTVGFVALGVGGAALVAGAVTGGLLLAKKSSLDGRCVDNQCSGLSTDDVDTYQTLRPTTTVLLAGGGGVAAAGALMVLLAPSGPAESGAVPLIGPAWLGVRGRF